LRRSCQHERGEHAGRILGVATADEEAALIVEVQLVELGDHGLSNTQARGGTGYDVAERPAPMLTADADALGLDLPCTPHLGVLVSTMVSGAAPVGHAGCGLDQLPDLSEQQRQSNGPNALDLDPWREDLDVAGGVVVARAVDLAEDNGELLRNRHRALPPSQDAGAFKEMDSRPRHTSCNPGAKQKWTPSSFV
jgi:hypothetical protein